VAVSFGSPYLIRDLPALKTYLCAWGIQEVVQRAAVSALFGETAIGGKLPVTIPGIARRGDGVERRVR
jgi:beta-N-acetylhexosaminidase